MQSSIPISKTFWLILLVLCCLWIISGINHLSSLGSNQYNAKRIIECLLLSALLFASGFSKAQISSYPAAIIGFIIVLIVGLASSLQSEDLIKSLSGYWLIISLYFALLVYSDVELEAKKIFYISLAISIAATLYVLVFYFYLSLDYLNGIFLKDSANSHAYSGYINRRFLNQVQTWILPLLILSACYVDNAKLPRKTFFKYLLLFSTASYIALLIITGGRGTVLAYLIAIPLLRAIFGSQFNYITIKIIQATLAGITVYFIISHLIPYILGIGVDPSVSSQSLMRTYDADRLTIWIAAINLIVENPIFGTAPLMYNSNSTIPYTHPHNSVLWLAAEMGLIITLPLTVIISRALWKYIAHIRQASKLSGTHRSQLSNEVIIGYCLSLSLICAVIHSLLSGLYIMPASQLVGLLIIILALSNYQSLHYQLHNRKLTAVTLSPTQALLIGALLLATAIPAYQYMQKTNFGSTVESEIRAPGFWLQDSFL